MSRTPSAFLSSESGSNAVQWIRTSSSDAVGDEMPLLSIPSIVIVGVLLLFKLNESEYAQAPPILTACRFTTDTRTARTRTFTPANTCAPVGPVAKRNEPG